MFGEMIARRSTGFACAGLAMLCVGMAWLSGGSMAFLSPFSLFFSILAFTLGIFALIALRP
jgi:hypothetical protein